MMIKKIIKINITVIFVLLLFACSNGRGANNSAVKNVLESGINGNVDEQVESTTIEEAGATVKNPYDKIDIDLTAMPQKLAYTTANRMNMMSEEYLGQIVKMNGICSIFHDEKRDIYFFTCEINDETACCTLGIEFELLDDYKFPDDYPKEKDEVTVVGVFDTYKEGARTYKTLRKAVIV